MNDRQHNMGLDGCVVDAICEALSIVFWKVQCPYVSEKHKGPWWAAAATGQWWAAELQDKHIPIEWDLNLERFIPKKEIIK